MRRLLVVLAALATVITVAGTASAAPTHAAKCSSGGHSGMDDMDMSGSKKCAETNRKVVAGARTVTVTGDDFTFSPREITMKAGEDVTIALSADDVQHDFFVKGIGHVVHAKKGKTAQGGLRINKAGTYKFWCTVAGHKQAGMTGTITVTT
jgi:uncharacterized cupredoxin-like copper-binding protein